MLGKKITWLGERRKNKIQEMMQASHFPLLQYSTFESKTWPFWVGASALLCLSPSCSKDSESVGTVRCWGRWSMRLELGYHDPVLIALKQENPSCPFPAAEQQSHWPFITPENLWIQKWAWGILRTPQNTWGGSLLSFVSVCLWKVLRLIHYLASIMLASYLSDL